MEHIEEAGVHSGDSACALPPFSLSKDQIDEIRLATCMLAKELKVIGLLNIQFAVKNGDIFILEVNPRGSRTVPFVSKVTGIPWAKMATKVIIGKTIKELGLVEITPKYTAIKEAVFPFKRFPGVDILLGPEMKSTGEVMGIDEDFGMAFIKSQIAAGQEVPLEGTVFISVRERDKKRIIDLAKSLVDMGFHLVATSGTARVLSEFGVYAKTVAKLDEGRPHVIDLIKNKEINLVINTPTGKNPLQDEIIIRQAALNHNIPVVTTIAGATATVGALKRYKKREVKVKPLQEYYKV